VARSCPSCGAESGDEARFCAQCGSALSPVAAGEARKVVTALFADVVGSTALGERLDPEDFTEIVGDAVRGMAECVERFGGSVSELSGDGLLALFGAPAAHEDDPERAALAGMAISESMRDYASQLERERGLGGFAVRVGIETGLAVLAQMGGGDKVEYGAMGDSLNTAARLQAKADPGTVLVGPETQRRIAHRFECAEPRELELKGKAEPVAAYPLIAERESEAPGRGLGGVEAPLVGRERELRLVQETLLGLADGRGGVLVVSGEAGLGKTRLLAELRRTGGARARWVEGRCVSYGESIPYWPFQGVMRDWLGPGGGLRASLRAECERLFRRRAEEFEEPLSIMLGLEAGGAASGIEPEILQQAIHSSFAELVGALGAETPLVVALDDLHWADPSSLALVERLLGLTGQVPLLLVLSGRPDPDHPFEGLRALAAAECADRLVAIELEALAEESERGLLAGLIGTGTLPERLQAELLDRAEGNPFYLEELVRSMVDAGALVRTGTGWRFESEAPVELPDTVENVVLARVDRLPPEAQEVLRAGAVLGRRFSLALLERVLGDAPAAGALSALEASDLLREGGSGEEQGYRFKHALIREATYRSLLRRRRQELHARAAEGIEELYPNRRDELVGLLALHSSAAGDDERALRYHRRAGEAARAIHSPEEAVEHYDAALEAAGRLGLGPDDRRVRELLLQRGVMVYDLGRSTRAAIRDVEMAVEAAARLGDAEFELDARMALGGLWRAQDFPRGLAHLEESLKLAERTGNPTAVMVTLSRTAIYLANGLRLRRARELADRAVEVARRESSEELMSFARDALKFVAQQVGDLDALEEHTGALKAALREKSPSGLGYGLLYETEFLLMWALAESATVPMARGDFAVAEERASEALDLLERRGSVGHEPIFREPLCRLGRASGDYASALGHGRRAVAAADRSTISEWGAWAAATYAWTLLDLRAGEEARELLTPWAARAEESGAMAQQIRCLSLLAWAASILGDRTGAQAARERAERLLADVDARPGEAWLFGAHAYFALARVLLDDGAHDAAERLLAPVLAAAERFRFLENVAYGALLMGRARLGRGDLDAADAHLARSLEVAASAGFAAEWEAEAALADLRRDQRRPDDSDRHAARARELVRRLAAGIGDDSLAETFRRRALGGRVASAR
jgi:class 3 adenylate cyclase/tetratricopeptide (TPR) repeat protein